MTAPEYHNEVTVAEAPITYRIVSRPLQDGKPSGWADHHIVSINEVTGNFSIEGSFGTFSYRWTSIGDTTLHAFLAGLSLDYFMGKASKQPWQIVDYDKTITQLKRQVIEARREWGMVPDRAREIWNEIVDLPNCNDLASEIYRTDCLSTWLDYSDPCVTVVHPGIRRFWDYIWRPFCESTLSKYPPKRMAA